jgi:MFS family permease
LCTGTALSALNSGMIAVALATIRRDFTLDIATVTWVITSYYLASAALQPLMGRLADRYGPRRLFTFGMAVIVLTGAHPVRADLLGPPRWSTQEQPLSAPLSAACL